MNNDKIELDIQNDFDYYNMENQNNFEHIGGENKMNPIGARLRDLRERQGKSVSAFASELGMSTQRYWHLENGDNGRTFEKLPKIAKALGCRIDDLFPEMDAPEEANVSEGKTVCADGFEENEWEGWVP